MSGLMGCPVKKGWIILKPSIPSTLRYPACKPDNWKCTELKMVKSLYGYFKGKNYLSDKTLHHPTCIYKKLSKFTSPSRGTYTRL